MPLLLTWTTPFSLRFPFIFGLFPLSSNPLIIFFSFPHNMLKSFLWFSLSSSHVKNCQIVSHTRLDSYPPMDLFLRGHVIYIVSLSSVNMVRILNFSSGNCLCELDLLSYMFSKARKFLFPLHIMELIRFAYSLVMWSGWFHYPLTFLLLFGRSDQFQNAFQWLSDKEPC